MGEWAEVSVVFRLKDGSLREIVTDKFINYVEKALYKSFKSFSADATHPNERYPYFWVCDVVKASLSN